MLASPSTLAAAVLPMMALPQPRRSRRLQPAAQGAETQLDLHKVYEQTAAMTWLTCTSWWVYDVASSSTHVCNV